MNWWTYEVLHHVRPDKPTQNTYVERFIKDLLNQGAGRKVLESLQEVRDMTADWLHGYSHHRPHKPLGRVNLYFQLAQEIEGFKQPWHQRIK